MSEPLRRHAGESAEVVVAQMTHLGDLARDLIGAVDAFGSGSPPRVAEISLSDVVGFFVRQRSRVPAAHAGAALRQARDDEHVLFLVFLGVDGEPLTGGPTRTYLVTAFDAELADSFGERDVIVFH